MTDLQISQKVADIVGIGKHYIGIPGWAVSMDAAYELITEVESNEANRPLFSLIHKSSDIPEDMGELVWHVKIRHCWGDFKEFFAEDATAPRAICLAYIAWKEAQ